MIKRFYLFVLLICTLVPMAGCKDHDEPIEADYLQSVDIVYTFTVSEDLLKYFNITALYLNTEGQEVGKQMNGPTLTITTSALKFPAKRPLTFSVTRTDVAPPSESPVWTTSTSVVVTKSYYPSGNKVNSMWTDSGSYSPLPDRFNEWAELFKKNMATGYTVTINADGSVSY